MICPTSDGEEVPSPATQMSLSVGYRHHIVTVVVSCEILLDCYFFFLVLRLRKLSSKVSVRGAWRENGTCSALSSSYQHLKCYSRKPVLPEGGHSFQAHNEYLFRVS